MNAIIVAYDESDISKRALDRAVELAQAFGAELVVTSVAPILEPASGRGAGGIDPVDPPEKHVEELRRARTTLEARGVNAHYQAAIGEPAEAIVELASSRGAGMIVVGSRHVNTIQRLLGQSVSDSVAHRARCDVLIVH
ncbi:MAG: universal stress protein [Solirubrobacterales bacterium]|nr:universal stress protein [Solirubrobacterales bacterium]